VADIAHIAILDCAKKGFLHSATCPIYFGSIWRNLTAFSIICVPPRINGV
jgi:hypothetical protein